MAFVYETVKAEDYELFNSLGFKRISEWALIPSRWCIDRERQMYLVAIGTFIDCPYYYDFSYKGRIIRMEYDSDNIGNRKEGAIFHHMVDRVFIPQSVFDDKEIIVESIKEAFSKWIGLCKPEEIKEILVEIKCEPEMVEVDYNGR